MYTKSMQISFVLTKLHWPEDTRGVSAPEAPMLDLRVHQI
jgi:hypothetical protein